jgi:8-hydroxy-5-deazaflavin:NADPH oxidoreductase
VISRVSVIGATGEEGFGLATRWAKAGIEIVIGSRDAGRASEAADRLRSIVPDANVSGLVNEEAAAAADMVVVTVPISGQTAIYRSIAPHVKEGAVVVDSTVPVEAAIGGKATHLVGIWEGSAAQHAASIIDKGTMCAAFHSLSAVALSEIETPLEGDVLVCGAKRSAREQVRELVEAIPDLHYVDAGPLENARFIEPITALLIGINHRYKVDRAGIKITGLPD